MFKNIRANTIDSVMRPARTRPLVVLFHPHFTLAGGAGNVVLESARRLRKTFDVVVVCIRVDRAVRRLFPDVQFTELGGPLPSAITYWLRLPLLQVRVHSLLALLRPDAVLPHVFPANWWVFFWRVFHRSTPCIWYCHEPSALVHSDEVLSAVPARVRFIFALVRPLLRLCDIAFVRHCCNAVIVNSQYTHAEIERVYGRTADALAYPGAESTEFFPVQSKHRYLLIAGRLTAYKRVHLAIEALACMRHRDYSLVIAGDGEERAALEALTERLGVRDRVEFCGDVPLDRRSELYASAALVLALREYESFGMVPIEALLSGTPVVAVRSGGLAETVVDGFNGVFVPSVQPQAIADTVDRVLSDSCLYASLCNNARASALRFSWEAHTDTVRSVVERVLQQHI